MIFNLYENIRDVDLSSDTVTASDVLSGKTFHLADGSSSTGTLSVVTYYVDSSDPSPNIGNDGDIYLKTSSGS